MTQQELTMYKCSKWAMDNRYYYNAVDDIFISIKDGFKVAEPAKDDNTSVLATYLEANQVIVVDKRKTTLPNPYGQHKRCRTAEEAALEFMGNTPDNCTSHSHTSDNPVDNNTRDNCPPNDCTSDAVQLHSNYNNTSESYTPDAMSASCNNTPDNCTPCNNVDDYVPDYEYIGDYDLQYAEGGKVYKVRIGGEDEGLVDGVCKGYESARSSWHAKKMECLKSCDYRKTCEIVLGTYVKQSFASIKKAVSRLIKRTLSAKYPNLKATFKFAEPYEKNGWHAHLIISFYDEIPADLYDTILTSWKKRIVPSADSLKTDKHLVVMRTFSSFDEFVKVLDYLNPTSKKKRDRLKYYPFNGRAMESYGDVSKPKKVIMPMANALKLTESEHKNIRREITILNASATVYHGEEVLVHNHQYYFNTSVDLLQSLADKIESVDEEKPNVPQHFSVTVYDENGEQFGKTMTEVDFDFDLRKAVELANLYETTPCWKDFSVVRFNVPLTLEKTVS